MTFPPPLSRNAGIALSAWTALGAAALAALCAFPAQASSHREAPFITTQSKVDGSDFYMFNSYESGRDGFVTDSDEGRARPVLRSLVLVEPARRRGYAHLPRAVGE